MAAITMTSTKTPVFGAGLLTAARFAGHFLAALVGVTFLGRHAEH
ncbi:hypothetical protein ABZ816_22905 [Actinosynnema sp. NPDC047251]|nr:hypothetical protein [Saccharothrix espanaensis]